MQAPKTAVSIRVLTISPGRMISLSFFHQTDGQCAQCHMQTLTKRPVRQRRSQIFSLHLSQITLQRSHSVKHKKHVCLSNLKAVTKLQLPYAEMIPSYAKVLYYIILHIM